MMNTSTITNTRSRPRKSLSPFAKLKKWKRKRLERDAGDEVMAHKIVPQDENSSNVNTVTAVRTSETGLVHIAIQPKVGRQLVQQQPSQAPQVPQVSLVQKSLKETGLDRPSGDGLSWCNLVVVATAVLLVIAFVLLWRPMPILGLVVSPSAWRTSLAE
jgi:hypothetical protein